MKFFSYFSGEQIKRVSNFIMIEMGGYALFDKVASWCVNNPRKALVLLAGGIVTMMPLFLVMCFGIATLLMTLTGFLVFEGTFSIKY